MFVCAHLFRVLWVVNVLLALIPLIFGSIWYISYLSSLYWPLENPTNVLYFHHWWYIKESGRMVEVKCRHVCVCIFPFEQQQKKKDQRHEQRRRPILNAIPWFFYGQFLLWTKESYHESTNSNTKGTIYPIWTIASVCHGTTHLDLRDRVNRKRR